MNIEQIRADIPFFQGKIFLNSAGASLMPRSIVEAIKAYLQQEERWGGYKISETQQSLINTFYKEAADLINTQPENIAFTHDATDAYARALSAIPFQSGDVIITSEDDYTSNQIQFLSLQKRHGISIKRIKTLENGDIDINNFQQLIKNYPPKLVAITHVPTNSGLVQNVEAIGEICHQKEIIFLVDACQSVGQFPVDVEKIKCDFLSTTGRKFLRGPRGTGFLYISDRMLEAGYAPLFIDGGSATWTDIDQYKTLSTARRFEHWEKPYALLVGLKTAMQYANAIGMDNIQNYNQQLMLRLRSNLSSISRVQLFDKGSATCNILTFRKQGSSLKQIQHILDQNGILYSVSTKEWGVIDFGKKGIEWAIRLSPHYFNTLDEMDEVANIIKSI